MMSEWEIKRRVEVESELRRALQEWRDAGGTIDALVEAINDLVDYRISINTREQG